MMCEKMEDERKTKVALQSVSNVAQTRNQKVLLSQTGQRIS